MFLIRRAYVIHPFFLNKTEYYKFNRKLRALTYEHTNETLK